MLANDDARVGQVHTDGCHEAFEHINLGPRCQENADRFNALPPFHRARGSRLSDIGDIGRAGASPLIGAGRFLAIEQRAVGKYRGNHCAIGRNRGMV